MANQPQYSEQRPPPQRVCYQHYDPYAPSPQWNRDDYTTPPGAYQPQGWVPSNGGGAAAASQSYHYGHGQGMYYDPEHRGGDSSRDPREVWSDDKLRRVTEHGFIRKVYGIVLTQLALTFFIAMLFTLNDGLQQLLLTYALPLMVLAAVVVMALACAMTCNRQLLRKYPTNYIFLLVFTLAESIIVTFVCVLSGSAVFFQAVLATTIIVAALTLFAFQTKYDFTSWMGGLFFVLMGFLVFGLLKALFFNSPTLNLLYAVFGAGLFSIYLVVDTQSLMSRSELSLGSDDYILAALTIYLDVINLFMHLLEIMRDCQGSSS